MNIWGNLNSVVVLIVILFSAELVYAEIYKYVDKDGQVRVTDNISNVPADQRDHVSTYKTEPQVTKGSPPSSSATDQPYVYLTDEEICYLRIFGKAFGGGDLADYRAMGLTRDKFDQLKSGMQTEYGLSDATVCSVVTPDHRFSSPESTWSRYKEALLHSNIDEAMECFSPDSVKRYREVFNALGKDRMKQMAADMRPIQKITQSADSAKYRIRRSEQGQEITYYIYFVNAFGNWKIQQF